MPSRREKRITPEEACRAIYLDFEGFKDSPPALLGWVCEYESQQVVLDRRLNRAAWNTTGTKAEKLSIAIQKLVDRSRSEGRVLVAFSQSEKRAIHRYTSISVGDQYRDARMIAKRWINRLHPDGRDSDNTLKSFLEYLGYEWPRYLGDGLATKRLRAVIEMLERKDSYGALTPTKKAQWTKLLQYNKIDCSGMRDLIMRAAAELAVAEEHGVIVK